MWGRFSTKEQNIGALQKVLGRFRTSTSARREEVVYGNAGRLGFGVLLVLVIISLAFWLLRRRTRGETAPMPVEAEEGVEEAVRLEEEEEASPSKDIRSIIRESVTRSGAGSRGEEESQAESTAPEQSRRAGDEELPIEDYDSLNVKQISERLAELSDEEVERLRSYEAANKNRSTLLRRLDERL